eukprot:RCo038925
MYSRGELQRNEVPPPLLHHLTEGKDVKLVRGERHQVQPRVPHQLQPLRGPDRVGQGPGGRDNSTGVVHVARPSVGDQRRVGGGDDRAWPRARHPGGTVQPPGPVADRRILPPPQLLAVVHQNRGALGGAAVLVGVARDAGDAGHREVRLGHCSAKPGLLQEGQQEAPQAAVDVHAHPFASRHLGKLRDGVHRAVREVRRRPYHKDRVGPDRPANRRGVHRQRGWVHGHVNNSHTKKVPRLVERRVSSVGDDNAGRPVAPAVGLVPVSLNHHGNRLRTPGGHHPAAVLIPTEHVHTHCHHL